MQGPNLLSPDAPQSTPLLDVAVPDGAPVLLNPVILSDKAVEMVKSAMEQEGLVGHGLRVGVIGGGCSGLQYLLDFSKDSLDDDVISEQSGVTVYVDPFSAAHLKGTVVDYVDGLQGSGFKFENPNIQRSCGCGMSFTT